MTDQPDEFSVQLHATFIPEGQVRFITAAVAADIGSTIITPKITPDGTGLVFELVTGVPAGELADLLDMIVEGLRTGKVTSTAVDAPREEANRG